MRRRKFLRNSAFAIAASAVLPAMGKQNADIKQKEFLELRVYQLSEGVNSKNLLKDYLKKALIPLMEKHQVKVVVFEEQDPGEPEKIYMLSAFFSPEIYLNIQDLLLTDQEYISAAQSYNEIPTENPVFSRYETFLLEAFDRFPSLEMPDNGNKLFELRIYQSATDDAGRRKVKMFNDEEIDLFFSVGMQPVFFGKILAGQYMPALIYMVSFADLESKDPDWEKFSSSEGWAELRSKPEYANTVSNIQSILLKPTEL